MDYQVLARKWRPKNFKELVGQDHVVTVLVNSLQQQRLHHAYLFTGTRGVGKTTIARIFAKSLNCEEGISTEPCGVCDTCKDIDQGRFIDLLEIDAASRTKVDDTREILDNVQYAPTRGRYKVYLIDEVHMLSRSSFNALLKTLEEPPEHVKFILATTDPQKLPVTVLSRCLQFHLKALTVGQIDNKLKQILLAENVTFQDEAIKLLAKSARGSMRDSLSLTDQAISQGNGDLRVDKIQQMLGGIDQNWIFKIVIALVKSDSQELMGLSQEIASYAPNYSRLLAELIQLFHLIALNQIVKSTIDLSKEHQLILNKLSKTLSAEDVQLYYQIALNGRKDLPYASDEQAAFDMTLLRLLAFKPMTVNDVVDNTIDNDRASKSIVFDELSASVLPKQSVPEKFVPEIAEPVIDDLEQASNTKDTSSNNLSEQTRPSGQHSVIDRALNNPNEKITNESTLHDEMLAIEQTASEQGYDSTPSYDFNKVISREDESTQINLPAEPTVLASDNMPPSALSHSGLAHHDSSTLEGAVSDNPVNQTPIERALATRNMLRSRKKQLEGDVKKSDDVKQRQIADEKEKADAHLSQIKADLPDIASIPEQVFTPEVIDPTVIRSANQVDRWANMIDAMALSARLRQLAIHATIDPSSTDELLKLQLDDATKHLSSDSAHHQLAQSLSEYFQKDIKVEIEVVEKTIADPYQIQSQINDKRLDYAKQLIHQDEHVQYFKEHFQAQVHEESIAAR